MATTQPTGNTTQQGYFRKHPWQKAAGIGGFNLALGTIDDNDEIEQTVLDRGKGNLIGDTLAGFAGAPGGALVGAGTIAHIIGNKTNNQTLKDAGFVFSQPVTALEIASDEYLGTNFMKTPEEIHWNESNIPKTAEWIDISNDKNAKYFTDKYDDHYLNGLTEADIQNGIPILPIITANGKYNTRDVLKFMGSIGMDTNKIGLSKIGLHKIGYNLTPEFFRDFVLSDYFKGDRNAALRDMGLDPQQVFADQHAKEVEQQQQQGNGNATDSITSKYMADWAAKKQAIEQGKWISGKSNIQNGQLVNGDDSPIFPDHPRNTVDETKQPNVHKDNATDQYLQYLMYRDYQKDQQRAASKKDLGLIPLLLAAYGAANIAR